MEKTNVNKPEYHPIAKRNQDVEAVGRYRDYQVHIRISRTASKTLASIQGLCYSNGQKESLGRLFEQVCLPALRNYCVKYAQKAAKARQDASAKKGQAKLPAPNGSGRRGILTSS